MKPQGIQGVHQSVRRRFGFDPSMRILSKQVEGRTVMIVLNND